MSLRQSTKQHSSFLVYFESDKEYFVASRPRIQYDGVVRQGLVCKVQWGTDPTDIADGCVVACGEYTEMRKEMALKNSCSPPAKRQKKDVVHQEKSKKPKKPNPPKKPNTPKEISKQAKVLRRAPPSQETEPQSSLPHLTTPQTTDNDSVNTPQPLQQQPTAPQQDEQVVLVPPQLTDLPPPIPQVTVSSPTAPQQDMLREAPPSQEAEPQSSLPHVPSPPQTTNNDSVNNPQQLQQQPTAPQQDVQVVPVPQQLIDLLPPTPQATVSSPQLSTFTPSTELQTAQFLRAALGIDLDEIAMPSLAETPTCLSILTTARRSLILNSPNNEQYNPDSDFEARVIHLLTHINRQLNNPSANRQSHQQNIINKRLDKVQADIKKLESKLDLIITTLQQHPVLQLNNDQTDVPTQDENVSTGNLPPLIQTEDLRLLKESTKTAGNFAKKIVERLFPELFGPDNLRLSYSYYGGHGTNKRELDPARRDTIQSYVSFYYPEMKNLKNYRLECVNKINEGLRRPLQKKVRRQSLVDVTSSLFNI